MKNNYELFPERLKNLMEKRGINTVQLSKETGISTATLSEWMSKKYSPSIIYLCKLANFFNVSTNYFTKED